MEDAALAAVEVLTPEQRELVLLHYGEGLTLSEIAARTGVNSQPFGACQSRP